MSTKRRDLYLGPEGAHRRAVYRPAGISREDLKNPTVGVVNTWSEVCPGHLHLRQLADRVKAGIWQAGGIPIEFGAISQCATPALGLPQMRYDLPARDLLAFDIETIIETQMLEAVVILVTCDKTIPAALLAAARLDLPAIILPGGAMEVSHYRGKPFTLSDLDENLFGTYLKGGICAEEIYEMEELACPSAGACSILGTANTMQCLSEALGMALPFASTVKAASTEQMVIAKETGQKIVELVNDERTPRKIMGEKVIYNGLKTLFSLGGSTNALLHLLALIHELELQDKFTLEDIGKMSLETKCIADIAPTGKYYIPDFHQAGGMPALLAKLKNELNEDINTVAGKSLSAYFNPRGPKGNNPIIRDFSNPVNETGGICILKGNLAPDGAVARMLNNTIPEHEGPARVFNNQTDAVSALQKKEINPGDVIVVREEGPRGAPGMPDIYAVLATIVGMGLEEDVAVVTDGRFSGFARGLGVCQVTPEAAVGGPLAAVKDGDLISINLKTRKLEVNISPEEIKERIASWKPKVCKDKGILSLYAKQAGPATRGARLND